MINVDIAVVGGGPAGSCVAALMAQAGHRVLVCEKETFPRYHIGESTVPGMLPILEELGVADEVFGHGFIRKAGLTLLWGRHRLPWSIYFAEVGPFEYAYQVVRSEFDALLLNRAKQCGATVVESMRVNDFLFRGDRCTGLVCASSDGERLEVRARLVVDASGQSALLGRRLGLVNWDARLKNVAIWSYFEGAESLEGRAAGNLLVENMPDGWLWLIPLPHGTQSVGFVTPAAATRGLAGLERMFRRSIDASLEVKRLLNPAHRVDAFRTARDWSYQCQRFSGPGFLLTGDAAGFVDPLFSSGLFLALNGASLAAKTMMRVLAEPQRETELLSIYDTVYKRFLGIVLSFTHYFYDASRDRTAYWARAQALIDPRQAMTDRRDFIFLISGLSGVHNIMDLEPEHALAELERSARRIGWLRAGGDPLLLQREAESMSPVQAQA